MPALTVHDVVDYCMALAADCVKRGNGRQANRLMNVEFAKVARQVSLWQMSSDLKVVLFLNPMERRLLSVHGPALGRRLWLDFVESFWLQSFTEVPLDRARLARVIESTAEWHRQILIKHQPFLRLALVDFSTSLPSKN
jgi:hypothetical protein